MPVVKMKVENLICRSCAYAITRMLRKMDLVKDVRVEVGTSQVEIEFEGDETNIAAFQNRLKLLGYPVSPGQKQILITQKP